jgi:hypothetical protein
VIEDRNDTHYRSLMRLASPSQTCDAAGMPTGAYRVEVKSRAAGSLAFRWEIYLGATAKPVAASFNLFRTGQQAQEAGERALAKLVAQRNAETEGD